jgi:acyl-homoserine lactone acylase PvdQ
VPNGESPDLEATRKLVGDRSGGEAELTELKDLLADWDYVTPKTRTPTGEDVERSGAALLFNAMMVYLIRDTFADEFAEIGYYSSGYFDVPLKSQLFSRVLIWMLESPEEAVTWDSQVGDVLVFDDMGTGETTETRTYQLVSALLKAKDRLAGEREFATVFGRKIDSPNSSNPEDWVWGNVHGLKLDGMLPFGQSLYQQPSEGLPFYPRGGGEFAVSPCDHGYDDFNFTCGSGSSLRMIHDMDPDDPTTYNAIPGGYSMDPDDESFMSEFDRWQEANPRKIETDPAKLEENGAEQVVYGAGR